MTKFFSGLLVLALGLGIASQADAGLRFSQIVGFSKDSTGAGSAYGMFGTAYNSTDNTQWIGCSISTNTTAQSLNCNATRADGQAVSCVSSNSQLISAARSLNSDAYMIFSWDSGSHCTSIYIEQNSYTQRK